MNPQQRQIDQLLAELRELKAQVRKLQKPSEPTSWIRAPRGDAGGDGILCVTPSEGIPAMTKTGSTYTVGEADCTTIDSDGDVTSASITVVNSVAEAIPGSILIGVVPWREDRTKHCIVVGNCPNSGRS